MKSMPNVCLNLLMFFVLLSPVVGAQRPVTRPAPPRPVPRASPTQAERQHQQRRQRLVRDARAASDSASPPAPSRKGAPGPVVDLPGKWKGARLSRRALDRAGRDISRFALAGRRVSFERIAGEMRIGADKKPVQVVCLRHRGRDGSVEIVMRHSTSDAERPRFVLGQRGVDGRTRWWSAGGWRRRIHVETVLGSSRITGTAFKYADFLPIQPPSSDLVLMESKVFDGVLGHRYRWKSGVGRSSTLLLDGVTRRPRRIEFFKPEAATASRRIDRLDVRVRGINRRAYVWRAIDRTRRLSATLVIKEFRLNDPIDKKFFAKEDFCAAPF